MKILTLLVLLASHIPFSTPFISKIRRGILPRSIDFVAVSFFLYYDLGFILEAVGAKYQNPFFDHFTTPQKQTRFSR